MLRVTVAHMTPPAQTVWENVERYDLNNESALLYLPGGAIVYVRLSNLIAIYFQPVAI